MFVALCTNLEFFKDKINLAIMLAPVACVHNASSKSVQDLARNPAAVAFVKKLGPELLPTPQVDGKISASFFKLVGQGTFGISKLSDSDPSLLS